MIYSISSKLKFKISTFWLVFLLMLAMAVTASASAIWNRVVPPMKHHAVQMTEGETRSPYLIPADYRGSGDLKYVKAVTLFVKFPDKSPTLDVNEVINKLFGHNRTFNALDNFFYHQSDSGFRVRFDHRERWAEMPHTLSHYHNAYHATDTHRAFIQDAMNQFSRVDFDQYDIVVVVPVHTGGILHGSNRTDIPGHELVQSANGSKARRFVTLGDGVYSEQQPYRILAHELGHLFGFPDLYPYYDHGWRPGTTDADYSVAGSWGIMSDSVRSRNYLLWHRFKAGWLHRSNSAYMYRGTTTFRLSSSADDNRMIVIPIDDETSPTSIYVVQRAPKIDSPDYQHTHGGTGVIIYKVHSDRATGLDPIEIQLPNSFYHGSARDQTRFGNRSASVFHKNQVFDDGAGVSIKVTEEDPDNHTASVEITVNRPGMATTIRKRSVFDKVRIGRQVWTAKNLDFAMANSECFENKPQNCNLYGRLYSLEAAQDACRALGEGWALPTDDEWLELSKFVGGAYGDGTSSDGTAGYQKLVSGGDSGFEGQLGGKSFFFKDQRKAYLYDLGKIGYFWTATRGKNDEQMSYTLRSTDKKLLRETITKQSKISVRCISRARSKAQRRGDTTLQ